MPESDVKNPPAAPSAGVHCPACGRNKDCTTSQLLRYSRKGLPWCCGNVMQTRGELALPIGNVADKRLGRRRMALKGAQIEFRRGTLGFGADLAVALVDVSDDGLCVHIKEAVAPGEEVEVVVCRPLGGKPIKRTGRVAWCRPGWGRGFLAEVVIMKRFTQPQLNEVAQ